MSTDTENKAQNPQGGRPPGKSKGWFSRRYKSEDESRAAKQRHLEKQAAKGKKFDYSPKSLRQRLNILDKRLGKNVGATKERARLHAAIVAEREAKKATA